MPGKYRLKSRVLYSTLVSAFMACATASVSAQPTSLLNSGGFEDASYILPSATRLNWDSSVYGKWAVGDPMTALGPTSGISPLDGSKMMSFVAVAGQSSADVYQIVDVSAYASEIDAGNAKASLSVFYNSVATSSAGMTLFRYSSAPTNFTGSGIAQLAGSVTQFTVDADLSTWQQFGLNDVPLTSGTRFLLFGLNHANNQPTTYADNAVLILSAVPEPSTCALLLVGLLVVFAFGSRPWSLFNTKLSQLSRAAA